MGVHGLTRLLQEEGWLLQPQDKSRISLWRSDNMLEIGPSVQERIQIIPPFSTLAIDGNGLAFQIYLVAYSRYYNDAAPLSRDRDIIALMPHCMPLSYLDQVTTEFVNRLQRNANMKLHVFWDGPTHRLKSETMETRRKARDKEWSALKNYCHFGALPFDSSPTCIDFLDNFPRSKLWLAQIRHSLKQCGGVDMEYCIEEADAQIAQASANQHDTYAVGNDSDYCIYAESKYIPLDSLQVSDNGTVTGIVITRSALANHFDLPSSQTMVELAMWMGNDHISQSMMYQLDNHVAFQEEDDGAVRKHKNNNNVRDKIQYIQNAGPEFRIESSTPQVQLAVDFSRALYNLQDVSGFPLDKPFDDTDEISGSSTPTVKLSPMDMSLKAVAFRYLQDHLDTVHDQHDENDGSFSLLHLEAFRQMHESSHDVQHQTQTVLTHRPAWSHVAAAFTIEQCLAKIIRSKRQAPVVRLTQPSSLFNHLKYYSVLASMDVSTDVEQSTIDKQPKQHTLPIDEFEKEILETVSKQRVTIIQGATGCGKSSRVPAMLLRAPPPPPLDSCTTPVREVKLFISQPRRIAAKSLVERVRSCEPDLKDDIALRMGHGVREYESPATRAWFVTTGYLVRLLASHPERFNDISHLVVDEVHERSVDTDVLCLLCRRLLVTNERIRLVLMSATMAATLYQQYFGVPEDPIFVGARRFPIQEYFVEDLATALSTPLPPNIERAVASIANLSAKGKCQVVPRATEMEQLYQLAVHIIMCAGRPGSSILVFVPGMSDIVSIVESVERLNVPPIRYVCYPIHSDVPFEEQLIAFDTPDANEVKVVVATNAAESSVTLPDVDVVICLGLCKQIVYNPRSHRQALECCWISRASATQRAGRTGRVREGSVYRLYPRVAFEQYMQEFEPGEMGRIPLDSVILSLKEMLKEEATPNLLQCLEPPDLSTIDRSFKSLFQSNFLTQPNDGGEITELGTFVIALGVDLMLGSLIGLGMQFGVLPEAIELGAVLSFPKSPWLMTNPLYHDPADYNDITARTFVSKCHFDAATRSEPFAIMNLLWEYEHIGNKSGWCRYYGVSAQRVRHLEATKKSIRGRVADYIGIDPTLLNVDGPPVRMHHSKLTILRVLQVWVFSAGIIECKPLYKEGADEITWPLGGATVTESHLEEVLDKERHPYELKSVQNIEQCGRFTPVEGPFTPKDFQDSFLDGFELRFVSYAIEKKFDVFWIQTDASIRVYAMSYVVASPEFDSVRNELLQKFEEARLSAVHSSSCSSQRGRRGRACGLWHVGGMDASGTDSVHFTKWTTTMPTRAKKLQKLRRLLRGIPKAESVMSCTFSRYSNSQDSPNFALFLQGNCDKVSDTDAQDLLATPHVECRTRQVNNTRQSITFHDGLQRPLPAYEGKDEAGDDVDSSWNRPLVKDIPEGARLLSVLASGRRNDHLIRLNSVEMDASADSDDMFDTASCTTFDISIPTKETKISQRWRQFGTNLGVFVSENSVPAATVAMKDPAELFACCANILELRGGNVKAEGMTLLPKGRLFVLLSLVSFGLQPAVGQGTDFDEKKEEILDMFEEDDPVTCRLLSWLHDGDIRHGMEEDDEADLDALIRINKAQKFHRSCEALGESLVCYPDKVLLLLQIFDTVDGYRTLPWDKLDESPFTAANIQKFKDEYRSKRRVSLSSKGTSETRARQVASSTYTKTNAKKNFTRKLPLKATAIDIFHPGEMASFDRLFVVDLPQGESVGENELPSTNIQCILWNYYCVNSGELRLRDDSIEFSAKYWRVWSVRDSKGCDWFKADFVNDTVPLPTQSHPKCVKDALKCVPPSISNIRMIDANVVFPGNDRSVVVLFSTVESALRMESAMWLELHFGEGDVHWYQQTLKELMEKAVALQ